MSNVNVSLKVSKASYQSKIEQLNGLLSEVDAKIQRFETLKMNTSKFIDESDSNYDNLIRNIEENIKACRSAREATLASIKMMQDTLSDMDEFVQKSGQVLEDGVEEAKAGFKVAVEGLKAAATVAEFVK